jgi:hypothetical protein
MLPYPEKSVFLNPTFPRLTQKERVLLVEEVELEKDL